jgi:hypothetical protein
MTYVLAEERMGAIISRQHPAIFSGFGGFRENERAIQRHHDWVSSICI